MKPVHSESDPVSDFNRASVPSYPIGNSTSEATESSLIQAVKEAILMLVPFSFHSLEIGRSQIQADRLCHQTYFALLGCYGSRNIPYDTKMSLSLSLSPPPSPPSFLIPK